MGVQPVERVDGSLQQGPRVDGMRQAFQRGQLHLHLGDPVGVADEGVGAEGLGEIRTRFLGVVLGQGEFA